MRTAADSTVCEAFLSASSFLQNLPIPMDAAFDTLSWDYDHERFYGLVNPSALAAMRFRRPQIWEAMSSLNSRRESVWPFQLGLAFSGNVAELIAQAVASWVSTSEPRVHPAPLQFRVLRTELSQDVLRFCSRHGIIRYVQVALELIEESFSSLRDIHLQPEEDPETGDEWLTIDVKVAEEVEEILKDYDRYTDKWVALAPWPQREKIRLSYDII